MTKKPAMSKPAMSSTAAFLASVEADVQVLQPVLIPVDEIEPDPHNVRSEFRPIDGVVADSVTEALGGLADDIDVNKLSSPITVQEINGSYRIVMGERRWRAFMLNRSRGKPGYDSIPAYVRSFDGANAILSQLSENLQREDVTDIDVARSLKLALELDPSLQKQQFAKLLNKPPSYISRILGLLDPRFKGVIADGVITYASLLEQFKTLPPEAQQGLVAKAKAEGRALTSGDIVGARKEHGTKKNPVPKVDAAVARQAAKVIEQFAPQNESYDPGHALKVRQQVEPLPAAPGGGDSMSFDVPPEQMPAAERIGCKLTLAQLKLLFAMEGFDERTLDVPVSLALAPEEFERALGSIGGDMPERPEQLPTALVSRINSFVADK